MWRATKLGRKDWGEVVSALPHSSKVLSVWCCGWQQVKVVCCTWLNPLAVALGVSGVGHWTQPRPVFTSGVWSEILCGQPAGGWQCALQSWGRVSVPYPGAQGSKGRLSTKRKQMRPMAQRRAMASPPSLPHPVSNSLPFLAPGDTPEPICRITPPFP